MGDMPPASNLDVGDLTIASERRDGMWRKPYLVKDTESDTEIMATRDEIRQLAGAVGFGDGFTDTQLGMISLVLNQNMDQYDEDSQQLMKETANQAWEMIGQ